MNRAIKVSLALATATKLRRVEALRREVVACRQAYVNLLWNSDGELDAATLNRLSWPALSYRHRSNCLKLALEVVSSARKAAAATGDKASRPHCGQTITLSSLVSIKPANRDNRTDASFAL